MKCLLWLPRSIAGVASDAGLLCCGRRPRLSCTVFRANAGACPQPEPKRGIGAGVQRADCLLWGRTDRLWLRNVSGAAELPAERSDRAGALKRAVARRRVFSGAGLLCVKVGRRQQRIRDRAFAGQSKTRIFPADSAFFSFRRQAAAQLPPESEAPVRRCCVRTPHVR